MKVIKINNQKCEVIFGNYMNGATAINLICLDGEDEGEPYATATINIPRIKLEKNEIIIKNYSENEGILDALVEANIVEDTGGKINVGYAYANICKLKTKEV